MKTVSINLYPYHELSDDAKKVALDKFNETNDQYYHTTEEFEASALAFLSKIDSSIGITNYQLGPYASNYIWFHTNDYHVDSLISRNGNSNKNLLDIPAIKDVVEHYDNYPLTGNYTDDALCKQLHKMIINPKEDYSIRTIIEICLDELCGECVTQCEYELSEDFFIEHLESNYNEDEQPLYYKNGNLYQKES